MRNKNHIKTEFANDHYKTNSYMIAMNIKYRGRM